MTRLHNVRFIEFQNEIIAVLNKLQVIDGFDVDKLITKRRIYDGYGFTPSTWTSAIKIVGEVAVV